MKTKQDRIDVVNTVEENQSGKRDTEARERGLGKGA